MSNAVIRTKYDEHGKLDLIVDGVAYVLCRRPGCYPMIRTMQEWTEMADEPLSRGDRLKELGDVPAR